MWQSSRPASFSPAGLTLWPSQLERWLATLSGLSTQVRIPVGCWCRGVTIKCIVVPSWLTLMSYLQDLPFRCRLFFHAKPGTGFSLKIIFVDEFIVIVVYLVPMSSCPLPVGIGWYIWLCVVKHPSFHSLLNDFANIFSCHKDEFKHQYVYILTSLINMHMLS